MNGQVQIKSNSKKTDEDYKDQADRLIKYIEKTDAVILRGGENRSIDKCMRIFLNVINFIRIFVDHLIVHDKPTNTYSEYEDTVLCKLFRTYRCQEINASLMNIDFSEANMANLTKAILTDVLIDENTSFVGTEVTGLQTNVDLSIAKGMENFEEMVYQGIISKSSL